MCPMLALVLGTCFMPAHRLYWERCAVGLTVPISFDKQSTIFLVQQNCNLSFPTWTPAIRRTHLPFVSVATLIMRSDASLGCVGKLQGWNLMWHVVAAMKTRCHTKLKDNGTIFQSRVHKNRVVMCSQLWVPSFSTNPFWGPSRSVPAWNSQVCNLFVQKFTNSKFIRNDNFSTHEWSLIQSVGATMH